MAPKIFTLKDDVMHLDEENGKVFKGREDNNRFVSPLKALAFNFRFNQYFGIFPGQISEDFMRLKFNPFLLLWTFTVKLGFVGLIFTLMHFWLKDQGYTFWDYFHRFGAKTESTKKFTLTDYFAMISHFSFLQISANILFFNNLQLIPELTKLCETVKTLIHLEKDVANPSAKRLFVYRISVCVMCTIASIIYFSAVHGMSRNDEVTGYDYAILVIIIVALYVENQNHMFSELLFFRFATVLNHHLEKVVDHIDRRHAPGLPFCDCFILERADNLHQMFEAINEAFGNDIAVATFILVISVVFGLYLLLTFILFLRVNESYVVLFIAAYVLYSIIPSLRLYVLTQYSHRTHMVMEVRVIRHIAKTINSLADNWPFLKC